MVYFRNKGWGMILEDGGGERGGGDWVYSLQQIRSFPALKGLNLSLPTYIYWILEKFNWTLSSFLSIYILYMGEVKIVQPHFYDLNHTPSTLHSIFENHILVIYRTFSKRQLLLQGDHYLRGTLQRQYTENLRQICPEMKLRGLSPNSYIHVFVSYLYILLQVIRWTNSVNI